MTATRTAEVLSEADALLAALDREEKFELPHVTPRPADQGHLARRAGAAYRLPVLPCGCHDPASYQHRYGVCSDAA